MARQAPCSLPSNKRLRSTLRRSTALDFLGFENVCGFASQPKDPITKQTQIAQESNLAVMLRCWQQKGFLGIPYGPGPPLLWSPQIKKRLHVPAFNTQAMQTVGVTDK